MSGAIGNLGAGGDRDRDRRGLLGSDVNSLCASSRVQFRADVLQRRKEEREAREIERRREEEEREHRLEALRNQVGHYLPL